MSELSAHTINDTSNMTRNDFRKAICDGPKAEMEMILSAMDLDAEGIHEEAEESIDFKKLEVAAKKKTIL